jgi:hypothetical protein
MNMENDEFKQTNLNRQHQLIETQRSTIEKFVKDCLVRYNVSMQQVLSSLPNTSQGSSSTTINSFNGNGTPSSSSAAMMNLRFYKGSSSAGSQLSLNIVSTPTVQQQPPNINYLINTPASLTPSPLAQQSPKPSPANFVTSRQHLNNNNASNRTSMLITSADYLNSSTASQQYYGQQYPTQQIHIVGENTPISSQVQLRDSRNNSILNTNLKSSIGNQQSSSNIQANRRNSTAFT